MHMMIHFSFEEPAELFAGGGIRKSRIPMFYRRFANGAEAIRYAIEQQSAQTLAMTVVEVEDVRFDATDIRSLYFSDAYPLPRGVALAVASPPHV